MQHNKEKKKLTLHKETLKVLSQDATRAVVGGYGTALCNTGNSVCMCDSYHTIKGPYGCSTYRCTG